MHDPSLHQLRTFLSVVETGGVTSAAQALGLTQPAASQQLRELERIMGVRLLERVAGRAVPTAAGQALVEPARRAQAAVEDARAAAAAHRLGEVGRVRLGTGATACIHLLPPVLAELNERMPGLEVIIATGNTPDILRRIEDGDLDAALVTLPAALCRSLSTARIATDPLVALLPEAMAPKGRASLTAAELTTGCRSSSTRPERTRGRASTRDSGGRAWSRGPSWSWGASKPLRCWSPAAAAPRCCPRWRSAAIGATERSVVDDGHRPARGSRSAAATWAAVPDPRTTRS
ncbi:DNA-binding transcriptional regulator, LysR family [Belnapia rosea]|uniref:DNA-binding transcriptional regulator, LysR family n=2 Tax=Belnapia rosea TaxID=938405 RepID=A0A1G7BR29_9PROT|nr:DNA-binding transcriptional regulator, LysR family [Belnapia rosea]